uniref:Uncharacterized protein n=1 Tax=Brassica oleracea TaxID=3712 RepID=A0A3P6BUK9_BRAOL|nr:unnamed protein product [Brassica oleracea]
MLQVCYIKYPRVRNIDDPWVTVTRLNPRGRVQGSSELEDPLQPSTSGNLSAAEDLAGVGLVVDLTDFGEEAVVHVEDEPVIGESNDDQIRPRQRRGRGGTGSQSRDFSQIQDSASPHSSYHKSPSAAPAPAPLAPAAAPAPAPLDPMGVMSVAELVRQPGRDHLPYLTPFNRSGSRISAWINRMMYFRPRQRDIRLSLTSLQDKRHLWFRWSFAQEFNWNSDDTLFIYHHFVHKVKDNYGKQIQEWKKKWEINKVVPKSMNNTV